MITRRNFFQIAGAALFTAGAVEVTRAYSFLWAPPEPTIALTYAELEAAIQRAVEMTVSKFGGHVPYTARGIEMVQKAIESALPGVPATLLEQDRANRTIRLKLELDPSVAENVRITHRVSL